MDTDRRVKCWVKDEDGVWRMHRLDVLYPTAEEFAENMQSSLKRVIQEEFAND